MKTNVDISRQTDYAASTLKSVASVCRTIGSVFLFIDIIISFITFFFFSFQDAAGMGFIITLILLVPGIIGYIIFNVILTITFEAYANLLNNTYRTEKWLERIAKQICKDEEEKTNKETESMNVSEEKKPHPSGKNRKPVRVYLNKNGKINCPICQKEQHETNFSCVQCGQVFINGYSSTPFWCANCWHEGPYEGNCPECGSSSRLFNIK